jgi:exopolysaccharide biosynthesis protein
MKNNTDFRKKKNKVSNILIVLILALQLIASSFISCLLVFYGPFPLVREMVVGTSMSSFKHQYIAKMFLNDAQISQILNAGVTDTENSAENISDINIDHSNDNNIERYDINSSKFNCIYLLSIIRSESRSGIPTN